MPKSQTPLFPAEITPEMLEELRPLLIARLKRSGRKWLPEDAKDIAADGIAQAWEHRDKYRPGKGALEAWVWVITRNRASNEARKRGRRGPPPGPLTEAVPDRDPDEDLTPRCRAVRRAVSQLDPKTRETLYKHHWMGRSFKQMAGGDKRAYDRIRQTAARGYAAVRRSVGPMEDTSRGRRGSSGRHGESGEQDEA